VQEETKRVQTALSITMRSIGPII